MRVEEGGRQGRGPLELAAHADCAASSTKLTGMLVTRSNF